MEEVLIALIEKGDPAAEHVWQPDIDHPHSHQFDEIRQMDGPFPLAEQSGEVFHHPEDQEKNEGNAGNLCVRTHEGTHGRTIHRGKQRIKTLQWSSVM